MTSWFVPPGSKGAGLLLSMVLADGYRVAGRAGGHVTSQAIPGMETSSYPGGVTWNRVSAELLAMGKPPFTVHSFMCLWWVGGTFLAFVCFLPLNQTVASLRSEKSSATFQ